ncbi:flavin-containing monooxygenase [Paraburkholderia caballeronis]|uniref:Putative flavoprotein involved in K+ transport n=1 Tax=Paraburkholderia caballeronis TaxID=416943 RepID=A0A1H7QL65_9BURK|nr:NAD(P)/FAD-dependent oxidoreductase [Paraburkholderia caballeronis]PXW22527.1 putative flavoprotein involved in K+ transport [Paraburkholderia caballeronis]PXW96398.1 putative flavoprotein involved in K+ transport [Paraburkholderia caballeronis]RAJ92809.1 putative flavoprotein involved in K+ transport [Paraburkholderia caballeronis]SEE05176.1 putative flavoprotein involved in K+ transport [Paraburkholderia caballeronis]SEL47997.1 putative flavoprotein involved in K+ transport [Paraburkholde
MTVEMTSTDTLVVGAGQAGVAMSEHLGRLGVPHLVVERDRIAESWRTRRWDSLVANGPAWHDRFPGMEFDGLDPGSFVPKEQVASYFEAYAKRIDAPIRTGVEVRRVTRNTGRPGFSVETSDGMIDARRVVVATGPFQRPVIPAIAPRDPALFQIHSAAYRNSAQLPAGGVLVVGAGSSGVQIAEELLRAGRAVYLSVGPHDRPPRRYRGRDFCWWLGVLGEWEKEVAQPGREHVTIAVSGARGGYTVDFRQLAHQGMTLVGVTQSFENGVAAFAPDLADNLARGDENYLTVLDTADAYAARNGLDLPEEPEARVILPDPACVTDPVLELDLAAAGITSIVWATGYAVDFGWLDVDAFGANGKPLHQRGVSVEPGLYFIGLPWLSCRASAFIWGVWRDAQRVAEHIDTQRKYFAHHDAIQHGRETSAA